MVVIEEDIILICRESKRCDTGARALHLPYRGNDYPLVRENWAFMLTNAASDAQGWYHVG